MFQWLATKERQLTNKKPDYSKYTDEDWLHIRHGEKLRRLTVLGNAIDDIVVKDCGKLKLSPLERIEVESKVCRYLIDLMKTARNPEREVETGIL